MKFFLDNCLPLRLARALNALCRPEHEVSHLRDEKFDPAAPDAEWITQLARKGDWIIVSGDARIPKNAQNRQAWIQSGLTAFFMKKGFTKLPLWEQAWRTIRWWPAIVEQSRLVEAGAGFWVNYNTGKFEQVR